MKWLLWLVIFLALIPLAIFQIRVGYLGIHYYLGGFWAGLAVFLFFGFRFSLPLAVGVFFGAWSVLGWHWGLALLLAAPALVLVIPGMIGVIVEFIIEFITSPFRKRE